MHIASVAVFEGPSPPFRDVVARVRSKLPLVPRYRQVVRFVPFDLGRPVWVDDPHFNIDYHLRHTALPAPGGRGRAAEAGGPGHVAAPRPDPAPVGDLGRRRPRRGPVGDAVQDPPRHGRRGLGHRPDGGRSWTSPRRCPWPSPTSGSRRPSPTGALPGRPGPSSTWSANPYEQFRAVRAEHPGAPAGAAPGGRGDAGACPPWPDSSGRRRCRA